MDETGAASSTGNFVQFGGYYQSKVTDETLIATLTAKTGELPSDADDKSWTSYKYWSRPGEDFLPKNEIDFMWYQDITEGADKYRAVYYEYYRTYHGFFDNSDSSMLDPTKDYSQTMQDDNGYKKKIVYFFKYEPLLWEIITVKADGTAMMFTKKAIDAQLFHHTAEDTNGIKANNYEHSDIRAWLNVELYNTVFSETEKAIIQTTTVDNSAASAARKPDQYGNPIDMTPFACNNTQDKVFLLSAAELADKTLFPEEGGAETRKKRTDYAMMQGLETTYSSYAPCLTRSPLESSGYTQRWTWGTPDQRIYANYFITYAKSSGIAPTINVRL